MASNYSFYSIPVYWFLALAPHAYAVGSYSLELTHCDQLTGAGWRSEEGQQGFLGQHEPTQHRLPREEHFERRSCEVRAR